MPGAAVAEKQNVETFAAREHARESAGGGRLRSEDAHVDVAQRIARDAHEGPADLDRPDEYEDRDERDDARDGKAEDGRQPRRTPHHAHGSGAMLLGCAADGLTGARRASSHVPR